MSDSESEWESEHEFPPTRVNSIYDRVPMEIRVPEYNSEQEDSEHDSEQYDSEQYDSEQDEPQLPVDPPPLPPPRNYPPDQVTQIVQYYLNTPEIEQDEFNSGIKFLKKKIYSYFIYMCLQSILIEDDSLINYKYFIFILMKEWSFYLEQDETQYTKTCNFDNDFESYYNELIESSRRGIEHYYFFINSETNKVLTFTRDEIEEKVKDFMNWHFYCKIEQHDLTTWNTTIYEISPIFIKIKIHPNYDSLISLRDIFSILKYQTRLFYVDIRDSSDSRFLTATYENLTNTNTNMNICTREKITSLKKCINEPRNQNKKLKK